MWYAGYHPGSRAGFASEGAGVPRPDPCVAALFLPCRFPAREAIAKGSRSMRYQPIENHGIVGNMHSAALVGLDGSVDWLCLPRFDSPSVFGAILDADKGGRFRIA